jgi:TraY domain-containing protein
VTTQMTKEIKIRLSEQLLSRLDAAAERNGRSRNAEATARFERNLTDESPYPADRALVTFVSELTAGIGGLVGVLGPDARGSELAMLKGALCALLDELGADSDAKVMALGESAGRRFALDARAAMAKEPSRRNATDETLAEAAKAWGLKL